MGLFVQFLSQWPLAWLHHLGTVLGWVVYWASPSYRHRLKANSQNAGVTPAQRRQAVAEAGKMVMELPALWLRPADTPLDALVQWDGEAIVEQALQLGKGVIFFTPHLGCFEVCAQAYAERFGPQHAVTVLYRPARQVWLRQWMERSRNRPHLHTAPAELSGVRLMIRALRAGQAVGLLPDQVPPEGLGLWLPFFGRQAYTMTLGARLIQQTGAPVLLMWAERLAHGRGYSVRVQLAPAALSAATNTEQAARIINQAMEQLILQCPQQYLWGYNRYKSPRSLPAAADPA